MASEINSIIAVARKLKIPHVDYEYRFLRRSEIYAKVKQLSPYLALDTGLLFLKSGHPASLLVKVTFPEDVCDGHYTGKPCVPLVDIGRATDQASALFTVEQNGNGEQTIPLCRKISKVKAYAMELFRPNDNYWIWVIEEKGKVITHFYSSRS